MIFRIFLGKKEKNKTYTDHKISQEFVLSLFLQKFVKADFCCLSEDSDVQ